MAKPRSTRVRAQRATAIHVSLPIAVALAVLSAGAPIHAQLRPVDPNNSVFIDMSVIENTLPRGALPSVGVLRPMSGSALQLPPTQLPQSRLLSPSGAEVAVPSAAARPPARETARSEPAPALRRPTPAAKSAPKAKAMPRAQVTTQAAERTPPPPVSLPEAPKPLAAPPPPPAPEQTAKAVPKASAPPPPPTVAPPKPPEATPPPPVKASPPPAPAVPTQQAALPERAAKPPAAAPTPESMEIRFAAGDANLSDDSKQRLDSVAGSMRDNEASRLQLLAYAGEDKISPSKARRLSLSRALAVRSYLIAKGIRSTRIDVRALGDQVPNGEPNRVDLKIADR